MNRPVETLSLALYCNAKVRSRRRNFVKVRVPRFARQALGSGATVSRTSEESGNYGTSLPTFFFFRTVGF